MQRELLATQLCLQIITARNARAGDGAVADDQTLQAGCSLQHAGIAVLTQGLQRFADLREQRIGTNRAEGRDDRAGNAGGNGFCL